MIPLFDLRLREEDLAAVEEALRSPDLNDPERVTAFERAFAEELGVGHAVAVSSCTAALHLAYRVLGLGPGDEVVVPSYTFVATAAAAVDAGAVPVFADVVDPVRPVLDPGGVAAALTQRTRAVVVVHFGGYAAPVDALRELCDEAGVALVEDAAHVPLGHLGGRRLGTIGDVGCFSFFSNKVLSVGEGGMLVTDRAELARHARELRDAGVVDRLDAVRAALGLARLGGLAEDVARRRDLTASYRELLAPVEGVQACFSDEEVAASSCYVMPVVLDDPAAQAPVRRRLREAHGVQTSLLYPGIHEFSYYRSRWPQVRLPRTESCSRREVTLPLFPALEDADLQHVVEALAQELRA